jgi:ribosomal protein L24E
MYVKKDGSVFYYKNRMCLKNHQTLGRVNRYTRWTEAGREAKAARKAGH